ncbi:MAG: hypothetical protein MI864_26085 [Pseudomonadales bacterium]|uniref:Uncharacterized protein n=1 Tax=Oleiphilus messinensis TaxID=141451 RepID=A0A1Y0IBJ4_9GAMM|nr:hypothetical protein [Oleiphilus messinensis]ARU57136.1 hypothetical protein OLMES_3093 [Oleiphilus messinensis]MCG8613997.1 hypothetical protein [Pseudomonadales bacterium]
MSASYLEIVELPNGDFALQKVDDSGEKLVTISFSKEAKDFLRENDVMVAKEMINAGIQAVGALSREMAEIEEQSSESHTVH